MVRMCWLSCSSLVGFVLSHPIAKCAIGWGTLFRADRRKAKRFSYSDVKVEAGRPSLLKRLASVQPLPGVADGFGMAYAACLYDDR